MHLACEAFANSRIVRRDDEQCTGHTGRFEQQLDRSLGICIVQAGRGFVRQQQARLIDDRTGNRHALLFANT